MAARPNRRTIPACRRRAATKANRPEKPARAGPRRGSLGRLGGGRTLAAAPDETVIARPLRCARCEAPLSAADQTLHGRYDKIELPKVAPVITRVERYAGQCRCCGTTTLAPLPEGLEPGSPFSPISSRWPCICASCTRQYQAEPPARTCSLAISEGALDAAFRAPKPGFDDRSVPYWPAAPRSRVCSTRRRADRRRGCWNWVFRTASW